MTYVIINTDNPDILPLCYFHDRETAEIVCDLVQERDEDNVYDVKFMPFHEVKIKNVPYCQEFMETQL